MNIFLSFSSLVAHEIPIIHQQKIALETNTIVDTYERSPAQKRRHEHLANHESYMMCPYKQPIKIDANYPVSINIYFNNFVQRKNNGKRHKNYHRNRHDSNNNVEDNDEIYLHITDEGSRINRNNCSNQQNNQNNDNELLINDKSTLTSKTTTMANAVPGIESAEQIKNNLIKNNHNIKDNGTNVNRNNSSNIKHFIDIYHWIVHR